MEIQSDLLSFDVASLFATSLGPLRSSRYPNDTPILSKTSEETQHLPNSKRTPESKASSTKSAARSLGVPDEGLQSKKRKRSDDSSLLEAQYLLRLSRSERRHGDSLASPTSTGKNRSEQASLNHAPQRTASRKGNLRKQDREEFVHGRQRAARQSPNRVLPQEQSTRTVFISNVAIAAVTSKTARKTLQRHLASPFITDGSGSPVQSIRFRSTPYSDSGLPRKAAYITKAVMPTTARSTHAYVVYKSDVDAERAVALLNGSMVLDRHIRVDSISSPMDQDHRRCIFVGNLGFVDDETAVNGDSDRSPSLPKAKHDADYEEGLWRIFGQIGIIDSVRIIRDKTTQVGKGFAYVQFRDANAVEKALLHNDKKFPPMLPRKLRVARARKETLSSRQSLLSHKAPFEPGKPTSLGRGEASKSQNLSKHSSNLRAYEGHRASPAARHQGRPTKRSKAFKSRKRSKGSSN